MQIIGYRKNSYKVKREAVGQVFDSDQQSVAEMVIKKQSSNVDSEQHPFQFITRISNFLYSQFLIPIWTSFISISLR